MNPDSQAVKLGSLGVLLKGQGIRRDDVQSSGIPCLRYGEIYTRFGDYTDSLASHVSPSVASSAIRLEKGDIIFAGSGETKAEIGKCTAWIGDDEAVVGGDTIILRRHGQDPVYLASLLNTASVANQKAARGQGDAVVHISARALGDIDLTLPTLDVQSRISKTILDTNGLIRSLQDLIVKKQSMKYGMMQQLLESEIRLPGFTQPWASRPISDVARQHRNGIDPRKHKEKIFQHFSLPAFDNGESPVIEAGSSIDSGKFVVPTDAVLVSKLNPRIPRVWAPESISSSAVASTEFVVMTAKPDCTRSFLKWLMKSAPVSSRMKLLATGTTGSHARIHPSQLAAMRLAMPALDEQRAIAHVLDDADRELLALTRRLQKARALKHGIMQGLLTGRIKLQVMEIST